MMSSDNPCGSSPVHPKSPLLRLSREVRNMILKELLTLDDFWPVEKNLWPTILQTCKQLHEEGAAILYNGRLVWALDIEFWRLRPFLHTLPDHRWKDKFFDQSFSPSVVSLTSKITKVMILFDLQGFLKHDDAPERMAQSMQEMTKVLRRAPGWQDVTVGVQVKAGEIITSDQLEMILRPLQYLRLHSLRIVGTELESPATRQLIELITSKQPVVDLFLMYKKLQEYVGRVTGEDRVVMLRGAKDPWYEHLERPWKAVRDQESELLKAVDAGKVGAFLIAREEILDVVARYVLKMQRSVFEDDPAGWSPTLKLGPCQRIPEDKQLG